MRVKKCAQKPSTSPRTNTLHIDFSNTSFTHRRQSIRGKNELIAKAIGIKSKQTLTVFDATAGLGRDAIVLATLGCNVVMCERSPIIYTALHDALTHASTEKWFQLLSLQLIHQDARDYLLVLQKNNYPDVVYIDPMFPERKKSALVKKEMRDLRDIVGDDLDSEQLFEIALKTAKKRVVVKRAKHAPLISSKKPDIVFEGKSSRFDVYLIL